MKAVCIIGLVVALLAFVCLGQYFLLGPDQPAIEDLWSQAAESVNPQDAVAEFQQPAVSAAPAIHTEFAPVPDDISGLFRYLAANKTLLSGETSVADKQEIHRHRIQAADKLLTLTLDRNQRFTAVREKLDALANLAAADTTARAALLAYVGEIENDSDPSVAGAAAIVELLADLNDRLARKDVNLDPVIAQATRVASQFPDNVDVLTELNTMGDVLLERGHRAVWIQLTKNLESAYRLNNDPQIQTIVRQMSSRLKLAEYDFDGVINRLRHGEQEAVNRFQTIVNNLCSDPDLNLLDVQRIFRAVQWLELEQQPELALQACQIIRTASRQSTTAEMRQMVEAFCNTTTVRLQLAGKSLPAGLPTADGGTLDLPRLNGRRTVLVFWSPAQPRSLELIKKIAAETGQSGDPSWNLVGVCFSKNPAVTRTLFGGTPPPWPNVICTDGSRDLAGEFGVTQTPHIMLLDEYQTIQTTAVSLTQTGDWLNRLTGLPQSVDR